MYILNVTQTKNTNGPSMRRQTLLFILRLRGPNHTKCSIRTQCENRIFMLGKLVTTVYIIMLKQNQNIRFLDGIGNRAAEVFEKAGLSTIDELRSVDVNSIRIQIAIDRMKTQCDTMPDVLATTQKLC